MSEPVKKSFAFGPLIEMTHFPGYDSSGDKSTGLLLGGIQTTLFLGNNYLKVSGLMGKEDPSRCYGTGEYETHSGKYTEYETEITECDIDGRAYYAGRAQFGHFLLKDKKGETGLSLFAGGELGKYNSDSTTPYDSTAKSVFAGLGGHISFGNLPFMVAIELLTGKHFESGVNGYSPFFFGGNLSISYTK